MRLEGRCESSAGSSRGTSWEAFYLVPKCGIDENNKHSRNHAAGHDATMGPQKAKSK